ncbi:hypothetical protein TWF694_004709 [Orbilia ellipsospora]|uniref:F-box domain-containing protein n=1 Tax=Orbilia ellipsospora TaxID=2528407 RepID=A0AAV9X238_9PEZI
MPLSIVNLPPEIHIEILSYLCFEDQVRASVACSIWDSVLTEPIFQRTRYHAKDTWSWGSDTIVHKFLSVNFDISCIAIDDSIQCHNFEMYQSPRFPWPPTYQKDTPPKLSINVTESKLLEDPVVRQPEGKNYEYRYFEASLTIENGYNLDLPNRYTRNYWDVTLKMKQGTTLHDLFRTISVAVSGRPAEGSELSTILRGPGWNLGTPWVADEFGLMPWGKPYKISIHPFAMENHYRARNRFESTHSTKVRITVDLL